jgi:hypothetical protein
MNKLLTLILTFLIFQFALISHGQTGKINSSSNFNFPEFQIAKGQLGKIKIGMTIDEAEKHFIGLTKQTTTVAEFGFDDESPAYSYYLGKEPVFAFLPKYGTDTVLFIVAVHKDLRTTNGLTPKSTVKELLIVYPDLTVGENLMSGGEFFDDKRNNWSFIFMTDPGAEVGEYPVVGDPSKPKQLNIKTDRILISKYNLN